MTRPQTPEAPQLEKSGDALHGLSCPDCSGVVPIPEGQAIVQCPYCGLRSMVHGERGVRRYQVPLQIDRPRALESLRGFLSSTRAIARNVERRARLVEDFVVYLPFWVNWARVLGWVFGKEKVGTGKNKRFVPREIKIAEDMSWNGAACDVAEFGVDRIPLDNQPLEPFDSDLLHEIGMVFEPIGSVSDAVSAAGDDFDRRVHKLANLDKIAQVFIREIRSRFGLVYYPLWVLRFLYRGRSFQVVVDGCSGKVLYGKAPGNTLYRAAVLVGGMALGAFLAVDAAALAAMIALNVEGDGTIAFLVGTLLLVGLGFITMGGAYRKFRYGEVYEYRGHRKVKRRIRRRKERGVFRAREMPS